jgi:hypothetical protein
MKPMTKTGWKLSPKYLGIWLGVVAVVGLGLSYVSGLPYWVASAIVAAALIVTGLNRRQESWWLSQHQEEDAYAQRRAAE